MHTISLRSDHSRFCGGHRPIWKSDGLQPDSDGVQPDSDGVQPDRDDGLQPTSDGLQPNRDGLPIFFSAIDMWMTRASCLFLRVLGREALRPLPTNIEPTINHTSHIYWNMLWLLKGSRLKKCFFGAQQKVWSGSQTISLAVQEVHFLANLRPRGVILFHYLPLIGEMSRTQVQARVYGPCHFLPVHELRPMAFFVNVLRPHAATMCHSIWDILGWIRNGNDFVARSTALPQGEGNVSGRRCPDHAPSII